MAFFIFPPAGGQISIPQAPPAFIQFRVYDCNTKTERVVKAEAAMMNAPLLRACLFWAGGIGAGIEFNAYLFRCISGTEAAPLYSSRQH